MDASSRRRPPRRPPGRRAIRGCIALAAVLAAGCGGPRAPSDWVAVREVTPPFLSEYRAADPAIAADAHGRVALTFVTRDPPGSDLWLSVSRDSGLTFSVPVRVNLRGGSVASYAEARPVAVFGPGGAFAVAWAGRRADGGRAVDLVVRASGDGGVTLGPPVAVNDDTAGSDPAAHHGFPALAFLPDGDLFAAWLDERDAVAGRGEPAVTALYHARSPDGGLTWSRNLKLADRVCPCCRPAAIADASGRVAVAYRSGPGDLRDPALAVSLDGGLGFSPGRVIAADGWRPEECPDQGAALTWDAATGGRYAWYTGAGEPGVYLVRWRLDHGAGGARRRLADGVRTARSPRLAALGRTTLIAVEARPEADTTRRVLAVRALGEEGLLTPWTFLGADTETGWLCGVDPRTALACWVEREEGEPRLRVARLRLRRAG